MWQLVAVFCYKLEVGKNNHSENKGLNNLMCAKTSTNGSHEKIYGPRNLIFDAQNHPNGPRNLIFDAQSHLPQHKWATKFYFWRPKHHKWATKSYFWRPKHHKWATKSYFWCPNGPRKQKIVAQITLWAMKYSWPKSFISTPKSGHWTSIFFSPPKLWASTVGRRKRFRRPTFRTSKICYWASISSVA